MGKLWCNDAQMCREEKDRYLKTATYTLALYAIRCLTLSVTHPCQAGANVRQ